MRFSELSLSAQAAYAELFEQARELALANGLAGLTGSFHKMPRKGRDYWYFGYRDVDGSNRMAYVGPDDDRVRALVERFHADRQGKPLVPAARAALALGCTATAPKHFRIVKRLAEYGFFRAGGVLIGTHAFLAMGNLLGVRWSSGAATLDVDFAHSGKNLSVALPANLKIDVHGALESLEMGLLPIVQFDGRSGAQYRNPHDQELRLDFLTPATRAGKAVRMPSLNVALQPLKFMEFSLEQTIQACLIANTGSCVVNLPSPERYAVHKLIVHGERPAAERTKATKDLMQAACLADYFASTGQAEAFNTAWRDALERGKGWRDRAMRGKMALFALAPECALKDLWDE